MYGAAVANHKLVADTRHANIQVPGIQPKRVGPVHCHQIAVGTGIRADGAVGVADHAAALDGKLVEGTNATDVKTVAVVPNRAGAADQHGVVAAGRTGADVAVSIEHLPAAGDHQAIAGAAGANIHAGAVAPE